MDYRNEDRGGALLELRDGQSIITGGERHMLEKVRQFRHLFSDDGKTECIDECPAAASRFRERHAAGSAVRRRALSKLS